MVSGIFFKRDVSFARILFDLKYSIILEMKEGAKEKMQEGTEKAKDMASKTGDKAHGERIMFFLMLVN